MTDGVEIDTQVAEQVRTALGTSADRALLARRLGPADTGDAAVSGALASWIDWLATSCGASAGAVRDTGADAARAAGAFVETDHALAAQVPTLGTRAV
jgi:hypothetical protein